jgi:hypothetical protein
VILAGDFPISLEVIPAYLSNRLVASSLIVGGFNDPGTRPMQAMRKSEAMRLASYGDVLVETVSAKRKARLAHRIVLAANQA